VLHCVTWTLFWVPVATFAVHAIDWLFLTDIQVPTELADRLMDLTG